MHLSIALDLVSESLLTVGLQRLSDDIFLLTMPATLEFTVSTSVAIRDNPQTTF